MNIISQRSRQSPNALQALCRLHLQMTFLKKFVTDGVLVTEIVKVQFYLRASGGLPFFESLAHFVDPLQPLLLGRVVHRLRRRGRGRVRGLRGLRGRGKGRWHEDGHLDGHGHAGAPRRLLDGGWPHLPVVGLVAVAVVGGPLGPEADGLQLALVVALPEISRDELGRSRRGRRGARPAPVNVLRLGAEGERLQPLLLLLLVELDDASRLLHADHATTRLGGFGKTHRLGSLMHRGGVGAGGRGRVQDLRRRPGTGHGGRHQGLDTLRGSGLDGLGLEQGLGVGLGLLGGLGPALGRAAGPHGCHGQLVDGFELGSRRSTKVRRVVKLSRWSGSSAGRSMATGMVRGCEQGANGSVRGAVRDVHVPVVRPPDRWDAAAVIVALVVALTELSLNELGRAAR